MKKLIIRNFLIFIGAALVLLTIGCAAPKNIALSENFWQNPKQKIVVASFNPPEAGVHLAGSQGLLEYGINSAANRGMNNYLKNAELRWYYEIASDLTKRLKERRFNATVYPQQLPEGEKANNVILAQLEGSKLLTIKLIAVGARREYYSIIPKGGPEAYCVLIGELIDPIDKKVWWRYETSIKQPVQGEWDQAPNYPNFNNALQVAVNEAREDLLDSFFSGH